MNRREAIQKTSAILGFTASSPILISILNGCVPEKTIDWQPSFFSQDQAILVGDIAETILPRTNTPGALDVGVDAFIDHVVYSCYEKSAQNYFIKGLEAIDQESNLLDGDIFVNMSTEKKTQLLTNIENKAVHSNIDVEPKSQPFWLQMKSLTLLGYFTSEQIMKKHLEYVPIPTRLEGCIPLKDNQKLIVGNHI
ncbi:MAG: gluconate 2-dehydrogenase subunit 3 family protein [Fulvivirga sp.]|nr:gluconate 2-dehydrogenase subunit 3 family protein [Fulvivirga sp.]